MITTVKTVLTVESPAFGNNGYIPTRFSCNGANVNPTLIIKDLPKYTESLVLIMDDPDAPGGTYDHWIMWNIPPLQKIEENSTPGIQGKNTAKQNSYMGPCPPSGGPHRYFFKLYALDAKLDLPQTTGKRALLKAMEDHIIGFGELVGLYKR